MVAYVHSLALRSLLVFSLSPFLTISRVDSFHNAVSGTTWNNLLATSTNRISFGRGAIGHVAINNEATAWDVSIATDMPNGSCKSLRFRLGRLLTT